MIDNITEAQANRTVVKMSIYILAYSKLQEEEEKRHLHDSCIPRMQIVAL